MEKKCIPTVAAEAKSSNKCTYVHSLKREINCLRQIEEKVAKVLVVFNISNNCDSKNQKEDVNVVAKIGFQTKELI